MEFSRLTISLDEYPEDFLNTELTKSEDVLPKIRKSKECGRRVCSVISCIDRDAGQVPLERAPERCFECCHGGVCAVSSSELYHDHFPLQCEENYGFLCHYFATLGAKLPLFSSHKARCKRLACICM